MVISQAKVIPPLNLALTRAKCKQILPEPVASGKELARCQRQGARKELIAGYRPHSNKLLEPVWHLLNLRPWPLPASIV